MGASSSSPGAVRLQRSSTKDLASNVLYCIEECSKWEDNSIIVSELLKTDITAAGPSELTAVGGGPELALQQRIQHAMKPYSDEPLETSASGLSGSPPTRASVGSSLPSVSEERSPTPPETKKMPPLDAQGFRHLLHSVDDVLRNSSGREYFRNISDVERAFTHPSSRYLLPPVGVDRNMASSRVFALAALQRLIEDQQGGEGNTTGRISNSIKANVSKVTSPLLGKRSSDVVYSDPASKEAPGEGFVRHTSYEKETAIRGSGEEHKSAAATSMLGSSTRQGGSAPLSFESLENQRIIVAAKYLFISHFLEILKQQAEKNYKIGVRLHALKKGFKSQQSFDALPPLHQLRISNIAEQNSQTLQLGIISFDRARMVLGWLYHNFALSAASFKISAATLQLKLHSGYLRGLMPSAGRESQIRDSELSEVNQLLAWMDSRHMKLLIEQQANERDSLSVGLYFKDSSLSGAIEANEVSDLSAKLWNELDAKKKNRVTPENLHECITNVSTKLDQKAQRYNKLMVEQEQLKHQVSDQSQYTYAKNDRELGHLKAEMGELESTLCQIYTYFHMQFVDHVFPNVASGTRVHDLSRVASVDHLLNRLEDMEKQSHINVIEQEMKTGKFESSEIKKQAGIEGTPKIGGGESRRGPREILSSIGRTIQGHPERKGEEAQAKSTLPYSEQQQAKTPLTRSGKEVGGEKSAGTGSGFWAAVPTVSATNVGEPQAKSTFETTPSKPSMMERVKETFPPKSTEEKTTAVAGPAKTESIPAATTTPTTATTARKIGAIGEPVISTRKESLVTTETPTLSPRTSDVDMETIRTAPSSPAHSPTGVSAYMKGEEESKGATPIFASIEHGAQEIVETVRTKLGL